MVNLIIFQCLSGTVASHGSSSHQTEGRSTQRHVWWLRQTENQAELEILDCILLSFVHTLLNRLFSTSVGYYGSNREFLHVAFQERPWYDYCVMCRQKQIMLNDGNGSYARFPSSPLAIHWSLIENVKVWLLMSFQWYDHWIFSLIKYLGLLLLFSYIKTSLPIVVCTLFWEPTASVGSDGMATES